MAVVLYVGILSHTSQTDMYIVQRRQPG